MADGASDAAPSTGRVTLARVAAAAGVSPSTASLAFASDPRVAAPTRARVLDVAAELGYGGPDPRARSLRRGRSGVVGVVLEDPLRDFFRDPMNVATLDGLAEELDTVGSSLLLITDTLGSPADLAGAVMDGVVLAGCGTRLRAAIAPLQRRGMPIVAIEAAPAPAVLSVTLDNREASAAVARHLRALGHADVAMITLPLEPTRARGPLFDERVAASDAFVATERIAGVRRLFPDAPGEVAAGSSVDEGERAALTLLSAATRPTALIAQSDLLAAGALRAASGLGLAVPAELSIAGFDGVRLDSIGGRTLTTMVQPGVEKGRAAGRALVDALAGRAPAPASFRCVLRVGDTTGPAPTLEIG